MSGSIQDMNNRINQNRSLKPSIHTRFKDNNRDNIYTDSEPTSTKLTFKKVSEIELRNIKDRIKNKALKESKKNIFIFLMIVLLLAISIYFLAQ